MNNFNKVDKENLYQSVYDMEGIRHPLENQKALDKAADYIAEKMKGYGMEVREQVFKIDGCDTPFRNIEGSIGPVGKKPAAVLVGHYDTVEISPGANDNAASIAIILEAGRILAQLEDPPPIYFVAVSLEESNNPMIFGRKIESALRLGIMDKNYRYTSWAVTKAMKAIDKIVSEEFLGGKSQGEAYRTALAKLGDDVPSALKTHIEEIIPLYDPITVVSSIGTRSRIGSHRWVQEAIETKKSIAYCIALDEPGIFKYDSGTQKKLGDLGFEMFNHQYRLDAENEIANFIALISNLESSKLAEIYHQYCQHKDIDLPSGWADVPWTFDEVVQNAAKALSSDHAPFWQAGIPAVFIFATSSARDPYVHTPADTIDKIDFDRLSDVTKSLVATLMDERSFEL